MLSVESSYYVSECPSIMPVTGSVFSVCDVSCGGPTKTECVKCRFWVALNSSAVLLGYQTQLLMEACQEIPLLS